MMEHNALAARILEYLAELDQVVERAVRFSESGAKTGIRVPLGAQKQPLE